MSLISEVNGFLDNVRYEYPSSCSGLPDFFKSLHSNYERLRSYKDEMEFYGFRNPYYVIKGVRDSWKDPFFRQTATKKKITFDRIQYSLAAHRIALSHATEAIEVRNGKRRITGEQAFQNASDGETGCNPDGVYNLSVLPYLPYRGEYMLLLSNLPKRDRYTYRKIVGALGQGKADRPHSRPIRPSRPASSRTIPTVPLGSEFESLLSKKAPRSDAAERSSRHHDGLIIDKYVRKCVGIGYAQLSYGEFIHDLLNYYLKKSRYERERYTSIFPGVSVDAPLHLFGKFSRSIEKKEELEGKLEDLKIHEKTTLIGAVAYYLVSNDEQRTAEMFNMPFSIVSRALERFRTLGIVEGKQLISKRTRDFLDHLKAER
ncbi:MAG TPA: DUF530 domain-containing protein [Methanomicrobia archaeon]|nr:DUF530 domain-containing protein [Methanomicrobia archaeon]